MRPQRSQASSTGTSVGTDIVRIIIRGALKIDALFVLVCIMRWRIILSARERLLKPCQIITDQPRALDRDSFGEGPIASLAAEEMAMVEKSLRAVMGML